MIPVHLYDSRSKQLLEVGMDENKKTYLYVCGPTVYNHAHIGNARPLMVFDTLRRTLKACGYDVIFISNYTDVDDKIIQAAKKEQISEYELTSKYIQAYEKLRKDLNVLLPDYTPKVTENMDKFELGIAVQKVYDFIWDEFCDWYIEIAKVRTYKKDEDTRAANSALWTLRTVLGQALKLLHPYMPFITEEIYCTLNPQEETIMLADWPVYKEEWNFSAEEEMLAHVKELVKGIRNLRTEMDVPPSRKAKVFIVSEDKALCETFESMKKTYQNLISASEVDVQSDKAGIGEDAVSVVIPGAVVYMPLEDLVDMEKEKERLLKEEERLKKELARSHGMLNNEKFVSKAPAAKIQEEKDKLAKYEQMMATVQERLAQMK